MNLTKRSLVVCLALAGACLAVAAPTPAQKVSNADNVKAYRMDAARFIYASYPERIYKGKLPPLVHAIVVAEIEVDSAGVVKDVNMIRVPTHAPEVTVAIKDMMNKASPLPVPAHLGGAKYTEIFLVDKSGRFQLDALTEGQR
jgi:hypothetical protein